jgi:hypothetical protein
MALPTQQRLFHKYYVAYIPSVLAASSPAIAVAGRGRVVDIRYVPIVATATANQTITPKVNATQMTLNGAGVTGTITNGASVNAVDAGATINPNGLNIVDQGDVIVLTLSGSGTAGGGFFTVTVDERSI